MSEVDDLKKQVEDLENEIERLEEGRRTAEQENFDLNKQIQEIKDMAYDIYKY